MKKTVKIVIPLALALAVRTVRFWNSTVNSESAGRSVSEIAAMFEANVCVNDPEYAFCHISVPEESYQGLNRTLTELGFDVRNAVLMHLD